jgi:ssDNA-binding Zn-finger/Zn-ribbon topoisomerase 1
MNIKIPILFGVLILGLYYGLIPLFGIEVWIRNSGWKTLSITQSLLNILISSITLYITVKFIKKDIYSKCPKCKNTYTYHKLKDGICPKCNTKTIDINSYYKIK